MGEELDFDLKITVFILSGLYFILLLIPSIQLLRIQIRTPEIGWTTQKLFFTLTLFSAFVRCGFFAVVPWLHGSFFMVNFEHEPLFTILDTLPTILFFSTAEIIFHARNQTISLPRKIRPLFMGVNMTAYLLLVVLWLLLFFYFQHTHLLDLVVNGYLAFLYFCTSLGFVFFGGKLYLMLKRFPIDSKGRKAKLREVGLVTLICALCCAVRAGFLITAVLLRNLDVNHYFIGSYFLVVEILPSFLILMILRKLPPKKKLETNSNTNSYSYSHSSDFGPGVQ